MRLLMLVVLTASFSLGKANDATERLDRAAVVLEEIMEISDKGIPQDLFEKAYCAVVVPGLKQGAFIIGGKYGKGFMTCRSATGKGWSAPAAVRIEGGSIGFQIGGAEVDVVMLVMNKSGGDKLLSSKFTLGGQGEVAAGPVGRSTTAQTDAQMRAEILSWSRSRGAFAGVSLQGATLRQDLDANKEMYGRTLQNREIIESTMAPPESASKLLSLLNKLSIKEMK